MGRAECEEPQGGEKREGTLKHARILPVSSASRKRRRRGMALVDATLAITVLGLLGLILLKLSLNVLIPRQWTMQQTLSDAYLTYEKAYAQRVPFETLTDANSPWPAQPQYATSSIEIGRTPGGTPVTGTVYRTRTADGGNYPIDGGTGTAAINPAAMKIWKVQSVLTYTIGGNTYVKSRTVLRAQ